MKYLSMFKFVKDKVTKAGMFDLTSVLCALVLGYFAWQLMVGQGADQFVSSSLLVKLFTAFLGLVIMRAALMNFDLLLGIKFKALFSSLEPKEKAMYMCARFIGVCILVGMILG